MKLENVSRRIFASKWLILLIIAIVLIVFGRELEISSLSKTGIVLGIGIDYSDGEYDVSVQTVVAKASPSGTGAASTYVTYSARDRTVLGAMDKISQKMGLTALLSHCNVAVFSPEALKQNHVHILTPLIRKLLLPAQAIVVSAAIPPEEVLSKKISTMENAPFYLQTVILENMGTEGVVRVTAKDMLAASMSFSEAQFIPYIEEEELDSPPIKPAASAEGGKEEKEYALILDKTYAFDRSRGYVIQKELSSAASIYLSDDVRGVVSAETEDGDTLLYRIVDKNSSKKADGMHIEMEMEITVEFLEAQLKDGGDVIKSGDEIVQEGIRALTDKLSRDLTECFEFSKSVNVDFLGLKNFVYQKIGYTLDKDCLGEIEFVPKFKIETKEHV